MRPSANFIYSIGVYKAPEFQTPIIIIIDIDLGNRTVTNDIDAVLEYINEKEERPIQGFLICYRDSYKFWCMVKVNEAGQFDGFCPPGANLDIKSMVSTIPPDGWNL